MYEEAVIIWESAPLVPTPAPNEIHLWSGHIAQWLPSLGELQNTLTADELLRANQFRFANDRAAFVIARGLLRLVLSKYLHLAPQDVCFSYGAQGKPFLPAFPACQFNVSHSGDLLVLATTQKHAVGIDIEKIRPEFANETLAESYFAAAEVVQLRSLPAAAQPAAFFRCWTRKEAYIKACAAGLSLPLDSFTVSLLPDAPPALLHVKNQPAEISRWSIHHFIPAPEFIGAAVTTCPNPTYKYFQLAA